MVKSLFALVAIVFLSACPPDIYDPSIPGGGSGSLAFQLSEVCPSGYTITFTVDNVDVGTATLAPKQSSEPFVMGTGIHTVRARTASGPARSWPNANIVVVAEAVTTHILGC